MSTCKHTTRVSLFSICLIVALSGCQSIPKDALTLGPESLAERQQQTRRFDGIGEKDALAAGAGVLQDLGFTITESEPSLGVVVGNKDRSAVRAGQVVGAVFVALLGGGVVPTDKSQRIIASLVTRPVSQVESDEDSFFVRVTFARIVLNTQNQVTAAEQLSNPELYVEFFDKLSKSVFLEGKKI